MNTLFRFVSIPSLAVPLFFAGMELQRTFFPRPPEKRPTDTPHFHLAHAAISAISAASKDMEKSRQLFVAVCEAAGAVSARDCTQVTAEDLRRAAAETLLAAWSAAWEDDESAVKAQLQLYDSMLQRQSLGISDTNSSSSGGGSSGFSSSSSSLLPAAAPQEKGGRKQKAAALTVPSVPTAASSTAMLIGSAPPPASPP